MKDIKLCIAGGRNITNFNLISKMADQIHKNYNVIEVVSGCAVGADKFGEMWAKKNNIKIVEFLPDYKSFGPKVAPIMRNKAMAEYADAVLLVWNGRTPGSTNMKEETTKRNKFLFEYIIES